MTALLREVAGRESTDELDAPGASRVVATLLARELDDLGLRLGLAGPELHRLRGQAYADLCAERVLEPSQASADARLVDRLRARLEEKGEAGPAPALVSSPGEPTGAVLRSPLPPAPEEPPRRGAPHGAPWLEVPTRRRG